MRVKIGITLKCFKIESSILNMVYTGLRYIETDRNWHLTLNIYMWSKSSRVKHVDWGYSGSVYTW